MTTCAAAVLLVAVACPGAADEAPADTPTCDGSHHEGGNWPSLNHDFSNSRYQNLESTIDTANVGSLAPAWRFSAADRGAPGGFQSTPIVSDGCVYIAASTGYAGPRGDVFALHADTGELVWHTVLRGSAIGLAAANGLIYAFADNAGGDGPFSPWEVAEVRAVALDSRTGALAWESDRLDNGDASHGVHAHASPLVYNAGGRSVLFAPLAGGWGDGVRVPMHFIDAITGATLKTSYALADAEYTAGHAGTGVWSTAALDPSTGYLYAGTADSEGHTRQHPFNNAILKIDGDPSRSTFGQVVGAYTGTSEHYVDEVEALPNPVCDATAAHPGARLTFFDGSASVACLELDLDFGASPNLYVDSNGHQLVSAMQKSGVFHVAQTGDMTPAWSQTAGAPSAASNGSTAATDGRRLYAPSTPNALFAFDGSAGGLEWTATTGAHFFSYQPPTVANGVVYQLTNVGVLTAFASDTGIPLLHRPLAADLDLAWCGGAGAGIAVARNTVFAPCDAAMGGLPGGTSGALVAYRLPPN